MKTLLFLFLSCAIYCQNNNWMPVQMQLSSEDAEQFDTIVAYHSLSSLTNSKDIVECLSHLYDVKPEIVQQELNDYITLYEETYQVAGYSFTMNEDIVNKTVYFNKYGYIIPYECAVAQLKGNSTDVKIMRDDKYQRVHHYEIED
jgi:hypothetical protein